MNILDLLTESSRFESLMNTIKTADKTKAQKEAIKQIKLSFKKERDKLGGAKVHTLDNKIGTLANVVYYYLDGHYTMKKAIKEYDDILKEMRDKGIKA